MPERYEYKVVEVRESLVGDQMSGGKTGTAPQREQQVGWHGDAPAGDPHRPDTHVAAPRTRRPRAQRQPVEAVKVSRLGYFGRLARTATLQPVRLPSSTTSTSKAAMALSR